jgi:thousand and one amino acid protein kinase
METELQQFNQERSERVRLLREKQERQLEHFDVESASMGFRYISQFHTFLILFLTCGLFSALALAEASQETYPEEEGSLSGSMLSLAHSNSSTSFPAGSL